jgi:S1-C subfamily serine protease
MRLISTIVIITGLLGFVAPSVDSKTAVEAEPQPDGSIPVPCIGLSVSPIVEMIAAVGEGDTVEVHGLRVADVEEDGIAAGMGIPDESWIMAAAAGDSTFEASEGRKGEELAGLCESAQPGEIIRLMMLWDGAHREIRLLIPGEEQKQVPKLGIHLGYMQKQPDGMVPPGVLVASVFQGTVAERVGIKQNDVILEWNQKKVNDPIELQKAVLSTGSGEMVALTLIRSGEQLVMGFRMP